MIVVDFIWDAFLVAGGILGYKWLSKPKPAPTRPPEPKKVMPVRRGPYLAKPIADIEFYDPNGNVLAKLETELEVLICAAGLTIRSKEVVTFTPPEDVLISSWHVWIGDHRMDVILPEIVSVSKGGHYKTWVEFPVNILPGNDFGRGGGDDRPPDPDPDPVQPPGKLVKA